MASPPTFHAVGAWPPRTEIDLENAAKGGHLTESHTLDLKRELTTTDGANKELARDLASLAIDGGLLIVGVDEKTGPGLTPVPLAGLAEKVEQVARARVDEPLSVTFIEIASSAQSSDGYLLVRVPASPRAPHMADNRYWGRGDKTKYPLSDAVVERLIALRARWAVSAEHALSDWIGRDPIAADRRQNAHLFVIADPVPPRERMLLDVFTTGDYTTVFRDLVSKTTIPAANSFSPDMPNSLSYFSTTAVGWAWKTYAVFGQRDEGEAQEREKEQGALIVEICENGQLRLMCGRATENYNGKKLMFDNLVLGLTGRIVSLVKVISEAAGFLGSWDFGVGITGLQGAISNQRYSRGWFEGPTYTKDTYITTNRASLADIESASGPVVERLLGRLFRAVGADRIDDVQQYFA